MPILAILASIWVLENARSGVAVVRFQAGETPVLSFARPKADGPVVVIAHGFAGSSQMMQGYALPLARAGYRVFAFDFLGHGRHPLPMSGDVTSIDGTTRLLINQTHSVIEAVSTGTQDVALLGHSMATDILVRVADERTDVGPVVLLSAFSKAIDPSTPDELLIIVGDWEPQLRDFALEAARMVDADAEAGQTVTNGQTMRRAFVVPRIEHVSILQSSVGRQEAVLWLDRFYSRSSEIGITPTGPAIVALFAGLVVLLSSLAARLPSQDIPPIRLSWRRLALITLLPMVAAPILAVSLDPGLMPVLVADYLALHLAIYGGLQLALLLAWRVPFGAFSPAAFFYLLFGCAMFGLALDRYAANFWPTDNRLWIIGVLALGAVPFFVCDARLGHRSSRVLRLLSHAAFLVSLAIAVALDFEGLFFVLMIAPVIVLFYIAFGTMGHAVSTRSGPLAPGLALGLLLAWSLGVSFPLFQG
ncbi:MAG: alpha/beta hydrolase [Boseongicola sp.]|nr:alpha/beta hydrolase [Boseongicola sp.]